MRVSLSCPECGSLLAVDQRYCLQCGARATPLPPNVAAYIDAIERRSRRVSPSMPAAATGEDPAFPSFLPFAMPSPRAAAVAVLAALAFGTLLGTGSQSRASSPIIVALSGPSALVAPIVRPPAPATLTGGGGGGGGSSSSSSSGGGGGGGGGGSGGGGGGSATTDVAGNSDGAGTPSAAPTSSTSTTTPGTASGLPPVKHVFLIVLSGQGYANSFSPNSKDTYLNRTLAGQGELVPSYYGVAQGDLANDIALISGQGPTAQTSVRCPQFEAIAPGKRSSDEQILGAGCVYPESTETLAGQLTSAHLTWKAYIEGLGPISGTSRDSRRARRRSVTRSRVTPVSTRDAHSAGDIRRSRRAEERRGAHAVLAANCRRPALGAADTEQSATSSDAYVTWRNPFVYFQSITSAKQCSSDDVGTAHLATDLKSEKTTASFSYIAPGPCDDGSDTPCRPKAPTGRRQADTFLKSVVAEILASPAYKDNGLLIITFDEAPQTGPHADANSCCNNPTYPNLPASTTPATGTTTTPSTATSTDTTTTPSTSTATGTTTTPSTTTATDTTTTPSTTTATAATTTPTTTTTTATDTTTTTTTATSTSTTPAGLLPGETAGGGQVGMLVISSYVTPGSTDGLDEVNHFSLLALIEDLFSLRQLGYASRTAGATDFSSALFNNYVN